MFTHAQLGLAYGGVQNKCVKLMRAALQSFGVSLSKGVPREYTASEAGNGLERFGDTTKASARWFRVSSSIECISPGTKARTLGSLRDSQRRLDR